MVVVEELVGGASRHPVSVVGSDGVVAAEPGVGLVLELVDAGEQSPIEGESPAFLEHGLVEPFNDGIVVWGPGVAERGRVPTHSEPLFYVARGNRWAWVSPSVVADEGA